jgi:2-succinyl-5-enolpyruvyl-6-hydroxy-3-cyclohexene-1-carboxylate synthase
VLTETTSNLHHDTFINNIDTIITPLNEDFENFRPEILVTLAEWWFQTDQSFFKKKQTKNHWHIDS